MVDKKKLNMGCGNDIREGWVNLDFFNPNVDVTHDLNKIPYPFKDNYFDYVYSYHVLEHLSQNPILVMDELIRICKSGALIEVHVPFYNSPSAAHFAHLHHGFNFSGFCPDEKRQYYYQNGRLKKVKESSQPTRYGKIIPKISMGKYSLREFLSLFISNLTYSVSFLYRVRKD